MKNINLTFGLKLNICMVGLVSLVLMITFFVVRHETGKQIERAISQTADKSQKAFKDLEQIIQKDLAKLSSRFTGSTRMPGALEASIDAQDINILIEASQYELDYAGITNNLIIFYDQANTPLIAILNKEVESIPERRPLISQKLGKIPKHLDGLILLHLIFL